MRKNNKKIKLKVFVALSGGVDSSVAALLLKNRGYDVAAVFMNCFNLDGCAERDAEDARRVAEKLQIPFYVWNFEEEYKKRVIDYVIDGYRAGITPNSDVMCNKEIKFGLFLKKALAAGADYVATGHYVRLERANDSRPAAGLASQGRAEEQAYPNADRFGLFVAKDSNKDQSYFLWTLTQKQLKHCLFPIGDYLKSEVREMARKAGLPTADKKDSQGICFLGKVSLRDFLKKYIPEQTGVVLNTRGEKVGEHSGAYFYTIGQRHGLGIPGSLPYYISEKDTKTNTIIVAEGSDSPALYKKEIELTSLNWISGEEPKLPARVFARVRYRQQLSQATLLLSNSRRLKNGCTAKLIFDKPQKFVAAGQSAVFYSEDGEMLGGGVIL
jgi:tRNA-specific 2-thiouridylase